MSKTKIKFRNFLIQDCFVVCSSITIQGPIDWPASSSHRLDKVKNCTLVIGHVKILNARFTIDSSNSTTTQALFPHLVEITDYLLIFQAQNLNSLEKVFPRLAIIRGHKLFKQYALIVFLTNSLLQINLKSLIRVEKGSILLSRLYHSCYINTIDWSYLLKDQTQVLKPTITLFNSECFSQLCSPNCGLKSQLNTTALGTNCWSEKNCQIKCNPDCVNNCNLERPTECCASKLCMHCTGSGIRETETCVSCAKYRDLTSGQCVEKCPVNTVYYEQHSCIKWEDCSRLTTSLIKNYHLLTLYKSENSRLVAQKSVFVANGND
jgi:insulin-like growth factor 1 receptor